jgi:hypothetical protein
MLIIAGGRFGVWPALRQADTVPNALYAGALFIIGVIIWVTTWRWPHGWIGRLACAAGAVLLMGMACDVGRWGNTLLIEAWMAVLLAVGALTNYEC